ncbi:MAG: Nramp family divalent metal transporter [Opitutales bacterium]
MKTSISKETLPTKSKRGFLRNIGPALIVASVVVGPGSILTSSQVGADFGYTMIWVLALSCLLMLGMTALSARLGGSLEGSLCDEIRARSGKTLAILAGLCVFLVTTCFQFSNNLGVLAGLEPIANMGSGARVAIIVFVNGMIIAALFGFRSLYQPIERVMMVLIGLMIFGFAGNLLLASPSFLSVIQGLWPTLPEGAVGELLPHRTAEGLSDAFFPVQALIGTTFSIAGAFYVSYLVRKKGWTASDWKKGFTDSAIGIVVLGAISLMIMVTAASVLHDKVAGAELSGAADVALQLEPLFGSWAVVLFCLGLFAGAFSSFLVNALIGGTLLSDGLGLGSDMDGRWPKVFTVLGLLVGMGVAVTTESLGIRPLKLIIFAQSMTVLGNPVLAGILFWLAVRPRADGSASAPLWMKIAAGGGFVLVLFLALRTGIRLYLQNF